MIGRGPRAAQFQIGVNSFTLDCLPAYLDRQRMVQSGRMDGKGHSDPGRPFSVLSTVSDNYITETIIDNPNRERVYLV